MMSVDMQHRGSDGGRLGFVGSCLGVSYPHISSPNGHRFVLPSCRPSGFDSDGARTVASALGKAALDRAYLTHYGTLCGPDAVAAAVRQVEKGISDFEGFVTQAHCLHLEDELLIAHLAAEITKSVAGRLQSEGVCANSGRAGAGNGLLDGLLEVEVHLAAEGLAQLAERWHSSSAR